VQLQEFSLNLGLFNGQPEALADSGQMHPHVAESNVQRENGMLQTVDSVKHSQSHVPTELLKVKLVPQSGVALHSQAQTLLLLLKSPRPAQLSVAEHSQAQVNGFQEAAPLQTCGSVGHLQAQEVWSHS